MLCAQTIVGEGSKTGIVENQNKHNFIYGLASGKLQTPQAMAKGKKTMRLQQNTFIDGLISGITFGLYNPTTVEVRRVILLSLRLKVEIREKMFICSIINFLLYFTFITNIKKQLTFYLFRLSA